MNTPAFASMGLRAAPNPCSDGIELRIALPAAAHARIALYDALGRAVAVLADHKFDAGVHVVAADISTLPPVSITARCSRAA